MVGEPPTSLPGVSGSDIGGMSMNCFTLHAVGNLARNPEVIAKGDISFTRFCLIGNDYAGKDDEGEAREITTSLWFVLCNQIDNTN